MVGKSTRSVDLKQLARVEDSILSHYKGFTTFRDLGQGSFLQLVSQNKELESLIAISSSHTEASALGVRKSDVIDLLRQCDVDSDKVSLKSTEFRERPIMRLQIQSRYTNIFVSIISYPLKISEKFLGWLCH